MKVQLSQRAARDPAKIADNITRATPSAARSIGAAITASQKLIAEHPRTGRLQKGRDLRKLVVPRSG